MKTSPTVPPMGSAQDSARVISFVHNTDTRRALGNTMVGRSSGRWKLKCPTGVAAQIGTNMIATNYVTALSPPV